MKVHLLIFAGDGCIITDVTSAVSPERNGGSPRNVIRIVANFLPDEAAFLFAMERPDFVPFFREIIDHPDCNQLETIVYGYIYWMTKLKLEKCFASNETLAGLCKSTPTSIRNALTALEKSGFILRKYVDDNKYKGRLEIIPLLVTTRVAPTGARGSTHRLQGVAPTGAQSKSIEGEHITSAFAEDSEPRVVDELEEIQKPRAPAKYPHSKEVFSWFPNPQKSWMALKNVQEREYGEYLWERGEKSVRGILAYCEKNKADPFFPKITKPSDLEKKWVDIADYADKH